MISGLSKTLTLVFSLSVHRLYAVLATQSSLACEQLVADLDSCFVLFNICLKDNNNKTIHPVLTVESNREQSWNHGDNEIHKKSEVKPFHIYNTVQKSKKKKIPEPFLLKPDSCLVNQKLG